MIIICKGYRNDWIFLCRECRSKNTGRYEGGLTVLCCARSVGILRSNAEGVGTSGRGCSDDGSAGIFCAGIVRTSKFIAEVVRTAGGGYSKGWLVGLCCIHFANASQ